MFRDAPVKIATVTVDHAACAQRQRPAAACVQDVRSSKSLAMARAVPKFHEWPVLFLVELPSESDRSASPPLVCGLTLKDLAYRISPALE